MPPAVLRAIGSQGREQGRAGQCPAFFSSAALAGSNRESEGNARSERLQVYYAPVGRPDKKRHVRQTLRADLDKTVGPLDRHVAHAGARV